jgi:hypothetical protein
MVLQWCYNGVAMVLQWSYNSVTMVLQWCYNGVLCACLGRARHGQELPLEVKGVENKGSDVRK